jgi:hypothetical protein
VCKKQHHPHYTSIRRREKEKKPGDLLPSSALPLQCICPTTKLKRKQRKNAKKLFPDLTLSLYYKYTTQSHAYDTPYTPLHLS